MSRWHPFFFLPSSPLSFGPPAGLFERPSAPGPIWNAPWRTWNYPELPLAFGTPLRASGTRKALMDRPQGSLAVLVLFVGRRYYLRPLIRWPARSAIGTALGQWNGLRPIIFMCLSRKRRKTPSADCKLNLLGFSLYCYYLSICYYFNVITQYFVIF